MADASSSAYSFFGLGEPVQMQQQTTAVPWPAPVAAVGAAPAAKKKRNQPGNPNPDAEVIALSPRALMATNRFVCEVCGKGFQREQNLQLHRRSHNLPWKLKQRSSNKDVPPRRRRVYLCPEPSCAHHEPARALGDLTGIKKHYSRKHGEKKWKCDKCSKRYAVQSDWKAHSKTCGTREYRCDCGTLFSRRDSFITHRAFCDALAQDTARMLPIVGTGMYGGMPLGLTGLGAASRLPTFQDQPHSSGGASTISGNGAATAQFVEHLMQSSAAAGSPRFRPTQQPAPSPSSPFYLGDGAEDGQAGHTSLMLHGKPAFHGLMQLPEPHGEPGTNSSLLNLGFFSDGGSAGGQQDARLVFPDQFNCAAAGNGGRAGCGERGSGASNNNAEPATIFSGNMMGRGGGGTSFPSLYNSSESVAQPQMSATALLQKAAQMSATTSGGGGSDVNSFLRGLGSGGGASNGRSPTGAGLIAGESSSSRSASQAEDETQFRDLIMNTLAASGSGGAVFSGVFPGDGDSNLSTRDFLGVGGGSGGGGGVPRSMSGTAGMPLRHGAGAGAGMGSLDSEMK